MNKKENQPHYTEAMKMAIADIMEACHKEGKSHKIYLSKNGRAFVKVTSKKTGNEYNKYLNEEISIKLSKEYNITYIPKQKK